MKYVGSKARIANKLLPVILSGVSSSAVFVDVFMGGCNLLDKVRDRPRIGNDKNKYLVAMFRQLSQGWEPPGQVTRDQYKAVAANPDGFAPEFVAFVLFLCSFGGKWNGGFAEDRKGGRNYAAEGKRNLLKQAARLRGCQFLNYDFAELTDHLPPPDNCVIYCDPPYNGTLGYAVDFDRQGFYAWVRLLACLDYQVYVSEYDLPDEFESVLSIPRKRRGVDAWQTDSERLFRVREW